MDRFDLVLYASRPPVSGLFETKAPSRCSSADLRRQVIRARAFAARRPQEKVRMLQRDELCDPQLIEPEATSCLKRSAERLLLSPRAIVRILRVARVIADMEECVRTGETHIIEALSYRVSTLEQC